MTTAIHLTSPGGTALTLHLGLGNDYRAAIRTLEARGRRVVCTSIVGTQLRTSRGAVELGKDGAERAMQALSDLDQVYARERATERKDSDASKASARQEVEAGVQAELRRVAVNSAREQKEVSWAARGWE